MRKKVLVCGISFCIFSGVFQISMVKEGDRSWLSASLSTPRAATIDGDIEEQDRSDVPTTGGKPAFATKADVMISSAESLIKSKDYDSAEEMAEKVTASYPDYVPGWLILAYCRSLMGKYEESNDAYAEALKLGAGKMVILTRIAYNYIKLEDWTKARESYLSILEEDENNVDVLRQLGYLETKLGNYAGAQGYYERVLAIEPENGRVMYILSRVMEKLGDRDQAKKYLQEAAGIEPENKKYLGRLASLMMKDREFDAALPYLEKLVELEPGNYSYHRNLGVALYELGKKLEAKDEFERVVALGGNMKGLHAPLADCFRVSGENEKAERYIREGLSSDSHKAWLYSIWGKILENRKDYDGAIAKFNKAVRIGEEPWSAYAKKQIQRQRQLKRRNKLILKQRAATENKKH